MSNSPWRWTQRGLLVLASCGAICVGAVAASAGEGSLGVFVAANAMCLALFWWCWIDARLRGTPILHGMVLIMIFTWPISPVAYLIWSRGLVGLAIALLVVIVIFIMLSIGAVLGLLLMI